MKIIVTHMRPDLDAVGAVWVIKRFLPGWEEAKVRFVPAGERWGGAGRLPHVENDARQPLVRSLSKTPSSLSERRSPKVTPSSDRKSGSAFNSFSSGQSSTAQDAIEKIGDDEVIHVDTGLGPLDHHQTGDENTCAAKRAWEWAKKFPISNFQFPISKKDHKVEIEAGDRLMEMVCEIDHFKEVSWPDPVSDRYDITVARILDGLKLMERDDDRKIVEFGLVCLDSLYHAFQNKVWAEEEIATKGVVFKTRFGKGIGVETLNDDVVHLSQRMGYAVAVRKDPRKGYIRIKARPSGNKQQDIDLTTVYDRLKKLDPQATWFLHVSKRMLLNGTTKNPKMRPTNLSLEQIIEVLKEI